MKEKGRFRRRGHQRGRPQSQQKVKVTTKTYKVVFFFTFQEVLANKQKISELSSECDQLNIVVEAEGNMDTPEILEISSNLKLFAGKAWYHIHTEREKNGWYESPRGKEPSFI